MLTARSSWTRCLGITAYVLMSLLLVILVSLASLHFRGQRLLSVQSASMTPTLQPGDALVIETVPFNQLRVGDIVSYKDDSNPEMTISHRLIDINKKTGLVTTAGDKLGMPDQTFPSSRIIGRATALAPGLGRVMDAARTPIGLTVLLYLPAVSIIDGEIRRLSACSSRRLVGRLI